MKYVWMLLRLLLAAAVIVLLALSMTHQGETNWFLSGGLLCSTLGIWLSIWWQRRERKKKQ